MFQNLLRHFQIRLQLHAERTPFCQERLPKLVDFRIIVKGTISTINTGEDCLETVVVRLLDWIELVVVAPRAVNSKTGESGHRRHDHIVSIQKPGDTLVYRVLAQLHVSDKIPGAGSNEACGDDTLGLLRKQDVTGELFLDKTSVGFVVVKRTNHVVAVRPGIQAGLVLVVAM